MSNSQSSEQTLDNLMAKLNNISAKLDNLLVSLDNSRPTQEEEVYYDVTDVAKLCKVARQTVYNWVSRGVLFANRATGRLLFKQADVMAFLEQRSQQPSSPTKAETDPEELSEQELKALAKEQDDLYDAERAYQIAHAYEINRLNNSHFNACLIVKNRFHIGSAELKRCCLLYETWDPTIS